MEISVIVPLLNEEENIYELYTRLSLVLKKNCNSYEIICVIDGSQDNTLNIIQKIVAADNHIK